MAHDPASAPLNLEPGFSGADAPAEADMYRCVHCGLCLSACPTYTVLGVETESPRGRIALMKAVNEGRLEITPIVASHWDACLQCRACEAVCPAGVPYGRIMEKTRSQLLTKDGGTSPKTGVSRLFLRAAAALALWHHHIAPIPVEHTHRRLHGAPVNQRHDTA